MGPSEVFYELVKKQKTRRRRIRKEKWIYVVASRGGGEKGGREVKGMRRKK